MSDERYSLRFKNEEIEVEIPNEKEEEKFLLVDNFFAILIFLIKKRNVPRPHPAVGTEVPPWADRRDLHTVGGNRCGRIIQNA